MHSIIIPIFVCCVMPISIMLILALTIMNKDNQRAKILMKAIECCPNLDPKKLADALQKPKKTPIQILNNRLLFGCLFTFIGVFCWVVVTLLFNKMDPKSAVISLLISTACFAIGLGFLITYWVTRKQIVQSEDSYNPFAEENPTNEINTDKDNTQD